MKKLFLYLTFINFTFQAFSQSSATNTMGKSALPSENERWDIDKFVWSHKYKGHAKGDKPLLDFHAIENWISVGGDDDLSISRDGKYFAFSIRNCMYKSWQHDSMIVQSASGSWRLAFSGASPGFFSRDSKQYIFPDKNGLCFLQTGSEQRRYITGVASYKLPSNRRNEWLAYQLKDNEKTLILQSLLTGKEKNFTGVSSYSFNNNNEWLVCQLTGEIKELLIHHLPTGKERRFSSVAGYLFDDSGHILLISTTNKTNNGRVTGLEYINLLLGGAPEIIWSASDTNTALGSFNFDHSGRHVVFIVQSFQPDGETQNETPSENSVWYWRQGMDKAVLKVNNETTGMDAGLLISGPPYFSNNSRYIRFSLHPRPQLRQPHPDAVKVDIWSYKDTILQSGQPSYLLNNPKRFHAIVDTEGSRLIYLNDYEQLRTNIKSDCDWAVIVKKEKKIKGDRFWKEDYHVDVAMDSSWLLSLKDGKRKYMVRGNDTYDFYTFYSPGNNYLVYFDLEQGCHYFSYNLNTGRLAKISAGVPIGHLGNQRFFDRIPGNATSKKAGIAAWLEGDAGVLVYDSYDIWQLDLDGKRPPVNITNGYGRQQEVIFTLSGENRHNDLGLPIIRDNEPLLLKAFNMKNKYNGFYHKVLGKKGDPEKLCMGPYKVDVLVCSGDRRRCQATDGTICIVKRQSATESPNYFLTTDFKVYQPVTNFRPQEQYNWLTSELHSFKQMDGSISQGILYKPENFDPAKKYPVIISFYGSLSEQLYQYPIPGYLDAPEIFSNPSWFVSHGYLVFLPDVYFFPNGKWGPSSVNTLDGAARYLRTLPFVDDAHLGASGHSNSGRFGYYVLTHSRSFAAMSVGAGATDVISMALSDDEGGLGRAIGKLKSAEVGAFGGGMGSLWQNKDTWLDQVSVLHADKVACPVLMFHNKKDGVPFSQPVEMFTALHRLEKKAWWLQYDEGGHRLDMTRDLKDYTIRYTQFFDHYLKGAPAPRWMTEGIPFQLKGVEARYELDPKGNCGNDCKICKAYKEGEAHK